MEKHFLTVLNNLQGLSFFNKKSSYKWAYNYLQEKEDYQKVFEESIRILTDLKFCQICGDIVFKNKCQNCHLSEKKLFIFENLETYYQILDKNIEIKKSFLVEFKRRSDYLNAEKINSFLARLEKFFLIPQNWEIKEIYLMYPPSYSGEIIKKSLIAFLKKSQLAIVLKVIPFGLPADSEIKYYDSNILRKVIENGQKVEIK